jgi:hypothetical protein
VVADDLFALVLDESVESLDDMLHAARVFHRQPRPHQHEEHQQKECNQNLHRYEIGDGCLGVCGLNVQSAQQRQGDAAEVSIEKCGKKELFH